jgi:UDP-2,3-diacylglucosamine hydrolase
MHNLTLPAQKNIYLASDFHLGHPQGDEGRKREARIVSWLREIYPTAAGLVLLGDVFDFWYEYKKVVPKGFVRFQAEIAHWSDTGIPVWLFAGNHDLWLRNYLEDELGVTVYHREQTVLWNDKKLFLAHGDGLGAGDYGYKVLKHTLFKNPLAQWAFDWLHPNIGVGLAHFWSASRKKNRHREVYRGKEKEWLWAHAQAIEQRQHHDYYVFGHRHLPLQLSVGEKSQYINLGEWINYNTYAIFDGNQCRLRRFRSPLNAT